MTRVLYVVGGGRNGSTALGVLLGNAPDAVFAGELRHAARSTRCACGADPCPVWSRVRPVSDPGWKEAPVGAPWASRRGRLNGDGVGLIHDLAHAAQVTWVVDSSKTPARLLRLARCVPVLPVWLVRDPTDLAASVASRQGQQPQAGRSLGAFLAWDLWSTVTCRAAAHRLGALVLRWEEVAADPVRAARQIADAGGPDATEAARRAVAGAVLPVGHPRVANRTVDGGFLRWEPTKPGVLSPGWAAAGRLAATWR